MKNSDLKYFTQTPILRQIGHRRLARLLSPFDQDLKAGGIPIREPRPGDDDYFPDLATALSAIERLPNRLRAVLLTIENAASPENKIPLAAAIKRRIPGISLSPDCPLDQGLELWFAAPDEFSQFVPPDRREIQPQIDTDERGLKTELVDEGICPTEKPPIPADIRVHRCSSVVTTDSETYERLARLSPGEYDRERQAESERLGIRKETLDEEVTRRRPLNEEGKGRAVHLPTVEPWPVPVIGADVLDEVSARFTLNLVLPPGAADAMALWSTHAHACPAFVYTPRLNLSSPEPGCGKTTTLDLIATMTPRPLRTENLTAPVLFRLVDQHQPTLLLDEVDSYLTQTDELRGLLNAGHKRGACAYRCEGESNAVRAFKAFAPAVLSGIGALPGTLRDRSIVIVLVRAEPDELKVRFDSLHTEIESILCRKLARWTQDNFAALQACDPAMPPTAFNRLADNWRPLFAIAQIAGGDWPRRAREAFNHLTNQENDDEAFALILLADIRQIFVESGCTRISSTQLVERLRALPGRPWQSNLGPSSAAALPKVDPSRAAYNWLANQLRRYSIQSHTLRVGPKRVKGYELVDFTRSFARWLQS